MTGARGAEFSELAPKDPTTGRLRNEFVALSAAGLENGTITEMTALDAFRIGQQIFIWLGITNPVLEVEGQPDNWITRIRLKPWWLRPNLEYRAPGTPIRSVSPVDNYLGIDRETFGSTSVLNNRYVWIPSPKRLDLTEWQTPNPPPASPPRHSDSLFLDDVWTFDLQSPTDADYQAAFARPGQQVSRWAAFLYPAMGYALGLTWEAEYAAGITGRLPQALVSLTYATGTLGASNYQESIG